MTAFFQWLACSASFILHPFYISMTDINYNTGSKALEVSVRIFTDDFEKTLRKSCNCKVDIASPADKKAMEKLASTYILKHLRVTIDGQARNLEFAGYQQEQESTWNYFVIKSVSKVNRIEIDNSLLHDYREEQINMLHIKANGKDYTDKLDYPNRLFAIVVK